MRSELFQAAVDTLLTAISVEFARGTSAACRRTAHLLRSIDTKTGPTPAEKLADELDDLMIAYLKACRETPDKAPGLEKKMKAKTAQLAALQDQGIDAHPSWADVE